MFQRTTAKIAIGGAVIALSASGTIAASAEPGDSENTTGDVSEQVEHLPDAAAETADETHGADVSAVAQQTEETGADKGAAVSTVARGDDSPGDDAEKTEETDDASSPEVGSIDTPAPVETPNRGGIGTATQASDGANSSGSEHAAEAASKGSANADRGD